MRLLYILSIVGLLSSCDSSPTTNEHMVPSDTIQTKTGLQYSYLARGTGRQVQKGSLVHTKLSLMVEDSVVWTSYSAKDSVFSFIVGESSVIKGFEEMAFLMREGDNVLAILPDSLAYGARGAGNVIPPHATLVYDRYEMSFVSPPRTNPVDTLLAVYLKGGLEEFEVVFESTSKDTSTYHVWSSVFADILFRKLQRDSLYSKEIELATYLGERNSDYNTYGYAINGHYYSRDYSGALDILDHIMATYKMPDTDSLEWLEFRQQLLDSIAN